MNRIRYISLMAIFAIVASACGTVIGPPPPTSVVTRTPAAGSTIVVNSTAFVTPEPTQTPRVVVQTQVVTQIVVATAQASKTPQATSTPVPAAISTLAPTDQMTTTQVITTAKALSETVMGKWNVQYFSGVTQQMLSWKLDDLVKDWNVFPNVDFAKYQFLAKDGVEYGMAESAFCQRGSTCDVNVPAMHYRLVTGDYQIAGIDGCNSNLLGAGCGIALFNVGTVTAMYRESFVDYGFTVEGRYWNGDAMPVTVRALLSHTAFNMLNLGASIGPLTLPVNAGANCSSAFGCKKVRLTFVVISGNQLLMKATTFVDR